MAILIKNGNIHDGKGNVFQQTDLLIEAGKIAEIAKGIEHKKAMVIEAKGKEVLPGFIDPISAWGCAAGRGQANDNDEKSEGMTPHLNAYYAFDSDSMKYQEVYGYGITSVAVAPSNSNILGGQMAVFKTWGTSVNDMLVKEKAAMKGSVNEKVKEAYGSRNQTPMTRMGIFEQLQQAFQKVHSKEEADLKDRKNQALKQVVDKAMPLVMSCNTAAEMEGLFHVLRNESVDLIIANSYGLNKEVFNQDCSIVLGDLVDGFSKYNRQVDYKTLFALIEQGRCVALSAFGDGTSVGREILLWNAHEIARQAAKHHVELSAETVLKMITSYPAQMLQVEDRIGSLEKGKDGDVVIWSQHPLKRYDAAVEAVIISGQIVMKGAAQ